MRAVIEIPQSPLAPFYARIGDMAYRDSDADVVLVEHPFFEHINLRLSLQDNLILSTVAEHLGFNLPLEPNTWTGNDTLRICWLGPTEWLVLASAQDVPRALALVSLGVGVSISGGQTLLRLWGKQVKMLLAKGSTLDFHSSVFKAGQCAQSSLGKAPCLFVQIQDEQPVYDLIIRRSFCNYFGYWLEDAAYEFSLRIER